MNNKIPRHPSHSRVDSTKLSSYMDCPRKYFWRYILGLRTNGGDFDLLFGQWYHEAMYCLLAQGLNASGVISAINRFDLLWREEFKDLPPEEMEFVLEKAKAKTPANARRAIVMYAQKFGKEQFDVLAAEIPGTVMVSISPERHLYYICDAFLLTDKGLKVRDFKTSRYALEGNWMHQWHLSSQIAAYHHAGELMSKELGVPFVGVEIDGICFRNPPREKKDGTLYAGGKDIEFQRVLIRRSAASISAWLEDVNAWLRNLEGDEAALEKATEADVAMKAFPKNTNSCTNFGLCAFHSLCMSRHNPLHWDCVDPPLGYKKEFWDPTKKEVQEINKEINKERRTE